jgi:two-component system, chemotaxis family, sensor kinase CheA
MTILDPAEVFRQEASELFDALEGALLDLGLRPDDRELVDTAFRALHTIKGSGAMFGFDEVASFTHEFETAFDRVRKGEIRPNQDLISVALAAKDYIRTLIEAPETTDSIIGDAILDDLHRLVEPDRSAKSKRARSRKRFSLRRRGPDGSFTSSSTPRFFATAPTRSISWKTSENSARASSWR